MTGGSAGSAERMWTGLGVVGRGWDPWVITPGWPGGEEDLDVGARLPGGRPQLADEVVGPRGDGPPTGKDVPCPGEQLPRQGVEAPVEAQSRPEPCLAGHPPEPQPPPPDVRAAGCYGSRRRPGSPRRVPGRRVVLRSAWPRRRPPDPPRASRGRRGCGR